MTRATYILVHNVALASGASQLVDDAIVTSDPWTWGMDGFHTRYQVSVRNAFGEDEIRDLPVSERIIVRRNIA